MTNTTQRPCTHSLRFGALVALAISACVAAPAAHAQPAAKPADTPEINQAYLREHYTKYEYRIAMRDGVRLFTAVYAPKDTSAAWPILLTRTPYSLKPYGVDQYPVPRGPMANYAKEKFIFVLQDVRGRYGSEGVFSHIRPHNPAKATPQDIDESTDCYDTIDWLVKNVPNNNGRVGMMGISYPGFYTSAGMIDSHPALKCASPQAPVADWFVGDDFHHNGAFYLPHAFHWLSFFGQTLEEPTREPPRVFDYKTPDGYEFYLRTGPLPNVEAQHFKGRITFWKELMEHGTYDEFWQSRNLRPHLKNIKAAVLTVGGWFDAEDLFGTLETYRAVERLNPGAVNALVMGPWAHGTWSMDAGDHLGSVYFAAKTGEFYRENIELPFLKQFLKDDRNAGLPEAYVFETGTNQWRRYDAWPPAAAQEAALYFHPDGRLSFDPPGDGASEYDEYVSDPAKPVPATGNIVFGMSKEHMLDDQRFASSRPDVLVYQTDVLDRDVTLAGPLRPRLLASTTGTDSDWVVKLIDVYSGDFPNPKDSPPTLQMGGYQQLVRAEPMRGKFRNSYENPEPFEPGRPAKIEYVMPDVYHTFRRGHRIMVHVQSSWFPVVDRNPQKFCDIYHAQPEDFQKATQRVYRAGAAGSQLGVMVLAP